MQVRTFVIMGLVLGGWVLSGGVVGAEEPASTEVKATAVMEPVVVSASKVVSPLSRIGSSVTVITREDLAAQGITHIGDALTTVPGVDVVTSGGPGQLAEAYIRGAESGRTLVMLNGVEINDAMSPGRAADFSHLSVDNVERIEVLRGPQSAVYGSGAMGGVVNIITRQGGKKWRGSLDVSGGKHSTWTSAAEATGSAQGVDVSAAASWGTSKGFSAAKRTRTYSEPQPDLEPNGYRLWNVDLGLGYAWAPDWSTHASYRQGQEDGQLDYFSGDFGDTSNFTKHSVQQTAHWDLVGQWTPWWKQALNAGLAQDDREYRDQPAPGEDYVSTYHGRNLNLDWRQQLDLVDWNSLVLGVNYRQEQGRSEDHQYYTYFDEQSTHFTGVYIEEQLAKWDAALNVSTRWDVYDRYGTRFTYRLAPVYTWTPSGTSVRGSYGTGFNAPSLYQLYSSYGNVNLQPETSAGWDAGVEQKVGHVFKTGVTYFQTDFTNQINYDFSTWRYANLGKVQTKGWEIYATAVPVQDLNVRVGYTKLTANDLSHEDVVGPLPLERRPDYKVTCDAGYTWKGVSTHVSAQRVGPRWGKESGMRVTLNPYTLVNVRVGYAVLTHLDASITVTNVLDAEYTEVVGYNTPRFAAMGGLTYRWE